MRLVEVMIPAGKRDAVLGVLDEHGVDYVMFDETSGRRYTAVVSFPIPTNAVEPILDQLREEAGIDRDAYTVVLDAQTVISQQYEQLEKEWEEAEEGERIARDELVASAEDLAPDWRPYVVLTVVSSIVATAGMLLDSAAVVVGSMVIAPLIGPAMTTSVGTIVDDREMFVRGVKLQTAGAVFAIAAAAVFAGMLRFGNIVPLSGAEVLEIGEVQERLAPDVLSLAVALGAGIAGALSLSSGVSAALVGVMIAAALVPPVAVIGIGIAWAEPAAIIGSSILVAVNFLSINFTALGTLWYQGYRPDRLFKTRSARREMGKQIAVLGVAILLLTTFLGGVTYASYQRAMFEDQAQTAVENLLAGNPDTSLVAFEIKYGTGFPFRTAETIVVTVGHPPGVDPPPLAEPIYDRISGLNDGPFGLGFNSDVLVEVHYVTVEYEPHEPPTPSGTPSGDRRRCGAVC